MTTLIAIAIYIGFTLYRSRESKALRSRDEMHDALMRTEIAQMKSRIAAIEDALKSSPFINYRNN